MSMDENGITAVPLDGNAAAGLLREIFAFETTVARATCASCGVAAEVGEARVYGAPMGAIFRCIGCDAVVFRVVRTPAGCWLDMQGARSFFVPLSKT